MHDGKFVNVDGLDHHGEEGVFDFTMDSNGYIKTTAHTSNAPQVSNMHFQGDKITAKVTYMGRSLDVTFRQPDEEQQEKLDAIWDQLLELDIVTGGLCPSSHPAVATSGASDFEKCLMSGVRKKSSVF